MVKIRAATRSDIPAIESLLSTSRLPPEGVLGHIDTFLVAEYKGAVTGVGGFENCGEGIGLLRSFAVSPAWRNQGVAKRLYEQLTRLARLTGVSRLYLLTVTAQTYFSKLGFARIERSRAPEVIQKTQQFSELCPDSSVLMVLSLV